MSKDAYNIFEDQNEEKDNLLTPATIKRLSMPSNMSNFQRSSLESKSQKNWNLFYKRNGNRFFKNRHWVKRCFYEDILKENDVNEPTKYLLEIGCGCGDFVLPFLQTFNKNFDLYIYCCDFAPRAIEILKSSQIYKEYHPQRIQAFVDDITVEHDLVSRELSGNLMDIISLIFVFSTLEKAKMNAAIKKIVHCMKVGGIIFFRDYAVNDSAMLRFKHESKIDERFYCRQDGTRAYFFNKLEIEDMFINASENKLEIIDSEYIHRTTENHATKEKYPRVFLQAKFKKTC